MTIPITFILPWVIFFATPFLAKFCAHVTSTKDFTSRELQIWVASLYAVEALTYATYRGWIRWS